MGSQKIGNFVVSDTKSGIIINDKRGDWQLKLSPHTNYYMSMKYYLDNNKPDEVEILLSSMYYATSTAVVDLGLIKVINNYFIESQKKAANPVSKKEEDEAVEDVKNELKFKEDGTETLL